MVSTVDLKIDPKLGLGIPDHLGNPRIPLLLIGHGSRDSDGRQAFLELAEHYQQISPQRPVIPCFLELTTPTIADGVAQCLAQGYTELVAMPVLLFGARHNKYDVTIELDRLQNQHPGLVIHYGAPIGIRLEILELLRRRIESLETVSTRGIPRSETALLFVGRGSSDPEANAETYKLARLLWEGSGFGELEVCFIGITHPRLEQGFERALRAKPRRILVVPYFLFTGVLVKKIQHITAEYQQAHPEVEFLELPELGLDPAVMQGLLDREREAVQGVGSMNCHLCKFRRAVADTHGSNHSHDHHSHDHQGHDQLGHDHGHSHHHHEHPHSAPDPYATPAAYHQKVWQVP